MSSRRSFEQLKHFESEVDRVYEERREAGSMREKVRSR